MPRHDLTPWVTALALLTPAAAPAEPPLPDPADIPKVDAVFVVEKLGEFRVRFHREQAPNHVAHFLTLAANGYYDGMSFHRVIAGFLVQAGDPASRDEDLANDGFGGPDYSLPEEPAGGTHARGTFSMAWREDRPGTAGSQFFITVADVPAVDGRATPIGEVVAGLDVVERISQMPAHRNKNPLNRVIIQEVRLEEEVDLAAPPTPVQAGTADSGAAAANL